MSSPVLLVLQSAAPYITGTGGTESVGPINFQGTITPTGTFLANATHTNNAFAVPTGAIGVIITPPTTNMVAIVYKTTSGDTGVNIPQATPSIFLFDPSNMPTNIYLNPGSTLSGNLGVKFF